MKLDVNSLRVGQTLTAVNSGISYKILSFTRKKNKVISVILKNDDCEKFTVNFTDINLFQ